MNQRSRLFQGRVPALMLAWCLLGLVMPSTAQTDDAPPPMTINDPMVPEDELALMLKPLTKEQLVVEADAWLALVQEKVAEISAAEIAAKRAARPTAPATDGQPTTAPAEPTSTAPAATQPGPDARAALLEQLVGLREERTALIDRLNTVLDALERKGGEADEYRTYIAAVAGITADVDVSDVSGLWVTIRGWLTSSEGGIRWGWNIFYFFLTILVSWIISRIVGNAVARALRMARNVSDLLRDFATSLTRRIVFFAGLLIAVTMLEITIGPVLAIVGAAGFVIAFALQGTLSNFASGLLILAYRPFDVGDVINAAGISGTVKSMNLVSTSIYTFDNQRMIVPNNAIWNGVITNITGLPTRRVDLVFGIAYDDDVDKAQQILEEIMADHPLVLDDPAPMVKLHELGDSSVNLICRPWVKTPDYWTVYWDVMKQAKQRFDAEGITIPFPQRDVHVYHAPPAPSEPDALA